MVLARSSMRKHRTDNAEICVADHSCGSYWSVGPHPEWVLSGARAGMTTVMRRIWPVDRAVTGGTVTF